MAAGNRQRTAGETALIGGRSRGSDAGSIPALITTGLHISCEFHILII